MLNGKAVGAYRGFFLLATVAHGKVVRSWLCYVDPWKGIKRRKGKVYGIKEG